jgi:hypothetical protein
MATTKQNSGGNSGSGGSRGRSSSSSSSSGGRKRDDSIVGRTGRTIKERPYTSAAIATGAVTAVAAAVAGAFFFRRSERSFAEIGEDWTDRIKEKTGFLFSEDEEDFDDGDTDQSQIAEEALTLKETGKKAKRPVDPTIEEEMKTGAISY